MTISVENYIKTVYNENTPGLGTKLGRVAGVLRISNAAATDMAKKLSVKGLLNYTRYKPLTLTKKGNEFALMIIRKHRLWESFLYSTLNLSLHEIHREAEQLEHVTSDFLADTIEKYLGNPSTDPHGKPIPEYNFDLPEAGTFLILSEAKPGYYKITKLNSADKDFLDFCKSNNILIGSELWIGKQFDSIKMTEIVISQKKFILGHDITSIINVKHL